jgi:tRNA threonylcarbamoyladenosine biosynthesis protein TsaB
VILGIDTATPSTVVGLLRADGTLIERRDDPPPGTRPNHASRVLELVAEVVEDWSAVERLAVGVGPGGFTGLRIGIASARALAQARDLPVVAVSSLHALAAGAGEGGPVAAVIDARRGEAFLGVYAGDRTLYEPRALAPEALAQAVAGVGAGVRAVGDGALRFRAELESAGAAVPADVEAVHRIGAGPLCRLGAAGRPADRDTLVPDYRREPDARPQ